ncbi:sensor histidine kinase [Streptomyces sp. A 4/2]|uniref:sensor histidine kinase n=1 Tax=Streptomyces sp. A 4/2 TaxID=2934314 RepID=UPI0035AB7A76
MPRVTRVTGKAWDKEHLAGALRRLPRTLREDLWTAPVDPLPPAGTPGWAAWRPVFVMLLLFGAVPVAVFHVQDMVPHDGVSGIPAYTVLLALLQGAALVAGVYRPLTAWWAMTALTAVVLRVGEPVVGPDLLFPWSPTGMALQGGALFLLALRVHPRRSAEALAITLLTGLVCSAFTTQVHNYDTPRAIPVLLATVVVGASLRGLRVARSEVVTQAGLTAEERARRTLLEERNRIARELHDVVAHHMSVISIQAQVARHLVEDPSDELTENLAGIRENAVDALNELRRVLGVLRSEDASSEGLRHAPQPTLGRLDELIGKVRGAGLTVVSETTGGRRPLPPGVELTVFRIVQEALSNVLRHAPDATARVEIGYRSAGVTVRVANTAPGGTPVPGRGMGHGLLGMRERAAMLGGDFANGPTPGGGYEVVAVLPLEDSV